MHGILEYYAIEEDKEKNKVVFLLNGGSEDDENLDHLLRDLSSPIFLEELDEDNSDWALLLSSEGIIKVESNKICIIRAVYIVDVVREYQL